MLPVIFVLQQKKPPFSKTPMVLLPSNTPVVRRKTKGKRIDFCVVSKETRDISLKASVSKTQSKGTSSDDAVMISLKKQHCKKRLYTMILNKY